jgi:hypothetical protein
MIFQKTDINERGVARFSSTCYKSIEFVIQLGRFYSSRARLAIIQTDEPNVGKWG